ncbi:MAG: DUF5689 domain-containing protein, partial [Prevotellaceae bacterium]|nr:DUF5689 domain-containing protein [Prevotellaceae bacterium]
MKVYNKINTFILGLSLALTGCTQYNFNDIAVEPFSGEELTATYTIKQLTETFVNPNDIFSAKKIEAEDSLIIKGIITSTDVGGNVYKYIVVQEETPNGRAIRISIDAAGVSTVYHLGRRVAVYLNGLYIGNYGKTPQIGIYSQRPQDGRVQPGTIPVSEAAKHIFPYGAPDKAAVVPQTMTISEILAADKAALNYKLICIKGAQFTGKGSDYNIPAAIPDKDKIFAPGTGGVGYPQSREIQDGTGSIFVSTSEYAKFARYPLPSDTITGDITAIVTWYNTSNESPKSGEIYHQLTLRTIDDLGKGFEAYH